MTSIDGTCRVVVDLRGIPWAEDAAEAERRLLGHPGVVTAQVDAVRRRAVVVHRADESLPELFNWLYRSRQPVAPSSPIRRPIDGRENCAGSV